MATEATPLEDAEDALDRLHRAIKRGTGCYLTSRMVAGLSVTFIGETASQPRERHAKGGSDGAE